MELFTDQEPVKVIKKQEKVEKPESQKFFTTNDCADKFGKSYQEIMRRAKELRLGRKIKSRVFFDADEVEKIGKSYNYDVSKLTPSIMEKEGKPRFTEKKNIILPENKIKDVDLKNRLPQMTYDGSIESVRVQSAFNKYLENQTALQRLDIYKSELEKSVLATEQEKIKMEQEKIKMEHAQERLNVTRGKLIERDYAKWLFLGQSKTMCSQLVNLFRRNELVISNYVKNGDTKGLIEYFETKVAEIIKEAKNFCKNEMKKEGSDHI